MRLITPGYIIDVRNTSYAYRYQAWSLFDSGVPTYRMNPLFPDWFFDFECLIQPGRKWLGKQLWRSKGTGVLDKQGRAKELAASLF